MNFASLDSESFIRQPFTFTFFFCKRIAMSKSKFHARVPTASSVKASYVALTINRVRCERVPYFRRAFNNNDSCKLRIWSARNSKNAGRNVYKNSPVVSQTPGYKWNVKFSAGQGAKEIASCIVTMAPSETLRRALNSTSHWSFLRLAPFRKF